VYRGVVKDCEVFIEFCLAINNICFEIEIGGGGVAFVESPYIDIVAMFLNMIKELVYSSHIVEKDSVIAFAVIAFSTFC
jgi:hypothetical protein